MHFKGHQGETQGNPLSPMIFNVVVDAVLYHWILVMAEEESRPEGFVWDVKRLEE